MYTAVALPWPVLNQTVKCEVGHRPILFHIVFLFQMVMVSATPHPSSLLSKALCVWLAWAVSMCGWPWFHALWAVILAMLLTSFCFMSLTVKWGHSWHLPPGLLWVLKEVRDVPSSLPGPQKSPWMQLYCCYHDNCHPVAQPPNTQNARRSWRALGRKMEMLVSPKGSSRKCKSILLLSDELNWSTEKTRSALKCIVGYRRTGDKNWGHCLTI